jgi:hypothetical protein
MSLWFGSRFTKSSRFKGCHSPLCVIVSRPAEVGEPPAGSFCARETRESKEPLQVFSYFYGCDDDEMDGDCR